MAFVIPSGLVTTYNTMSDSLIDFWHKDVIVVYPPLQTACINCITNTMPGLGISSARYKTGGPIPFNNLGVCPYCEGLGYTFTENTEIIPMIVYDLPGGNFIQSGMQLDIPAGSIETRFLLTYLPKIQRCQEIKLASGVESYQTHRFVKFSDPGFYGLGNRYIKMTWKPFRGAL